MMQSLSSRPIELFDQPGIGEVVKAISPNQRGRVKFRASFWPARFYRDADVEVSLRSGTLVPLEQVTVVGIDGITLLVQPIFSATQLA